MFDVFEGWPGNSAAVLDLGEQICCRHDVSILGGGFLAALEQLGIKTRYSFSATVAPTDDAVVATLYPDLRTLGGPDGRRAQILANNTGTFMVFAAGRRRQAADLLGHELDVMKNVYRRLVEQHVERRAAQSGDHLVHVPVGGAECGSHLRALASRAHRADPDWHAPFHGYLQGP